MVSDKDHQRNLKRIAKAIEEINKKLRAAGTQIVRSDQQIQLPEQKSQIRPNTSNNSN
jgi:hypothetical protein